jgi:hypothetical protein
LAFNHNFGTDVAIKMVIKGDLRISVWHPFDSQTGPGERMGIEGVVKEWRMLLPDLVLLENPLLFHLVNVVHYLINQFCF